jgi:DNA-binding NarL/FixJ family response regulator
MDQAAHEAWEELVGAAQRRLAQARVLLRQDAEAAEREIAVAERLLSAALAAWAGPDTALPDPDAPFVADREPYIEPLVEPLTPRELQVLHLLAEGLRNKEIALRIGVSERTATFHVGNVLGKLGADSRTEAVHFARRRGLVRD